MVGLRGSLLRRLVVAVIGVMSVGPSVRVQAQGIDQKGNGNGNRVPTPVVDVAMAAREPFAYWVEFKVDEKGYAQTAPFMVPQGKQLVIEYANSVACAPDGQKLSLNMLASYDIRGQKGTQQLKVLLQEQGAFMDMDVGFVMEHFGASQPMKAYIQGGQSFSFNAWRNGRAGPPAEIAVWISGYLAPAP